MKLSIGRPDLKNDTGHRKTQNGGPLLSTSFNDVIAAPSGPTESFAARLSSNSLHVLFSWEKKKQH